MTLEEATKILEEVATKLGEHFDAVQILVSWNENEESLFIHSGVGNWYARQGMAHEFITSEIAQHNAIQIAEHLNKKPGEGDEWKQQD